MDYEGVREAMVDLGEELDELEYDGVQETVEGENVVGKAIRDCREPRKKKLVVNYLKDVEKTIACEKDSAEKREALSCIARAKKRVLEAMTEDADDPTEGPQRALMVQEPSGAPPAVAQALGRAMTTPRGFSPIPAARPGAPVPAVRRR